jgi:ribosome biogenesis GTPase A
MTKARRMITEQSALVDVVCEIIDARIPQSSRNPDLTELTNNKPRLIVLNRSDLADADETLRWAEFLRRDAYVITCDSKSGKGVDTFERSVRNALSEKLKHYAERGMANRPIRAMVVGIPNAGKSTFINKLAKRKAAIAADKPGVTRGRQWVTVGKSLDLLDTPGILWPKIKSETQSENLAFTGAIKDAVLDVEELASKLCERIVLLYPELFAARYKLDSDGISGVEGYELLKMCAKKRGFLLSGGEFDTLRMSNILLDEFRGGVIGRITLEQISESRKQK